MLELPTGKINTAYPIFHRKTETTRGRSAVVGGSAVEPDIKRLEGGNAVPRMEKDNQEEEIEAKQRQSPWRNNF